LVVGQEIGVVRIRERALPPVRRRKATSDFFFSNLQNKEKVNLFSYVLKDFMR